MTAFEALKRRLSPNRETEDSSQPSSVLNSKGDGSEVAMISRTSSQNNPAEVHRPPSVRKRAPTTKEGVMAIVKSSWINVLVVAIPLGIASNFVWSPTVTFILNFIAIIPLAKLLGFATEEIALRTGEIMGGLLNASFGNAVELIISIISLTKNLVVVVQASMLGSILSNLLLVLGMCFWFGGIRFKEQSFNVTVAQTSASLLFIATTSLLLPASFYASVHSSETSTEVTSDILHISRATSVILLVIYFSYLYFQLRTHKELFLAPPPEARSFARQASQAPKDNIEAGRVADEDDEDDDDDDEEEPQMPFWMALLMLLVVTVLVAVCAEFLVDAINDVVEQWHISETFVGLILLPIVGNAAEHVTAVTVAMKNKMDLALGVAVGSSMQIALLVTPLMVIVGWGLQVEMSLLFNVYETAVMFIAVVMVNYLMMDGKSNWLEGFMLFALYLLLAISFYYYPDNASGTISGNA